MHRDLGHLARGLALLDPGRPLSLAAVVAGLRTSNLPIPNRLPLTRSLRVREGGSWELLSQVSHDCWSVTVQYSPCRLHCPLCGPP